MRRVRYQVACSLDGYIADEDGGYDWIVADEEIDFSDLYAQFDTLLMGRKTWEVVEKQISAMPELQAMKILVFSAELGDVPGGHRVVRPEEATAVVEELREGDGKDIWLYGGGELFRSLLEPGLVDTVELAIIPVLLGKGLPFLPRTEQRWPLRLTGQRTYRQSGIVLLEYDVDYG